MSSPAVHRIRAWLPTGSKTKPRAHSERLSGDDPGMDINPTETDRRDAIRVVLRNHGVLVGVRDEWADELIRSLAVATEPQREATL